MLHRKTLHIFFSLSLTFLFPLANHSFSFSSFSFSTNLSLFFCSSTSSSFSVNTPYCCSTTTLYFSRLSSTPILITLPFWIIIAWQCSLGLVWVLAVNVPLCWSVSCFTICPNCVSRFFLSMHLCFFICNRHFHKLIQGVFQLWGYIWLWRILTKILIWVLPIWWYCILFPP